MKNTTDIELGFGRWVIGPGESIPDADLSPAACVWYERHGCKSDKPAAVKVVAVTEAPEIVATTTLDDITPEPLRRRRGRPRKTKD